MPPFAGSRSEFPPPPDAAAAAIASDAMRLRDNANAIEP